jgi:Cu/Ag efflux protein CusF
MSNRVRILAVAVVVGSGIAGAAFQSGPAQVPAALAQAAPGGAGTAKVTDASVVTVRGTVQAVDTEKKTVTLKGPKRSLTLPIKDPKKLEMIKVGDPVVAKYYEALAIEVKKPGEGVPGASEQRAMSTSKPGETPAAVVGQEITATVTVVAIDKKAHTVTVKSHEGDTETIKARDPKNLDHLKVGDLVELKYTQALLISLDKAPKK